MALLNNLYIFAKEESLSSEVEVSEHPVEKGMDITDNVRRAPLVLSVSGEIVGKNAKKNEKSIRTWHQKGKLVTYIGSRTMKNAVISRFDTSYTNTIFKGCAFDMEIKEMRLAESPYKKKKKKTAKKTKAGSKQVSENKKGKVYHTVKKGETASSIAQKYKSNGCTVSFILKNNADAPKVKGDWRTLQIGTKLWVYTRK